MMSVVDNYNKNCYHRTPPRSEDNSNRLQDCAVRTA
jgi:hypothetical protein